MKPSRIRISLAALLTVFGFSRLAPADMPELAVVRELWRKHSLLSLSANARLEGLSARETHLNGEGR